MCQVVNERKKRGRCKKYQVFYTNEYETGMNRQQEDIHKNKIQF